MVGGRMRIKNSMGFTLIELIATITILGIIMLIAVPNVIGVVTKNKKQTYVNDARKMVTLAKYKFDSDATIERPTGSKCVVMKLDSLDRSELQEGPEGGDYDITQSFVLIRYESQQYIYYVQLVENYSKNGESLQSGVSLTQYEELVKTTAKNDINNTAKNDINNSEFKDINSPSTITSKTGCSDFSV